MGFVGIFRKNNIQVAYLPKTNIVGQVVSEILAPLCFDDSIQMTQAQFRRICMESLEHNWANILGTICPEMLIFWQVGLLDIVISEYPER